MEPVPRGIEFQPDREGLNWTLVLGRSGLSLRPILLIFCFLGQHWATFGDYFGRKTYGRLRGIAHFVAAPGAFVAPVFAGWWYDKMEDYALPLWIFTIFFGLGALSFGLMRKPKKVR